MCEARRIGREARQISREARQIIGTDVLRTFFAVELGDAARRAAAALARELAEQAGGDAVRWVRPEAYHVTLRFLGPTPRERIASLVAAVRGEMAALAPFELRVGALEGLPSWRRPRVIALDVEPREPLAQLAAAVERGVVAAGFAPEARAFRGHLTLGRVERPGAARALRGSCDAAPFPVDALAFFRSESGSRYTRLERIALAGNRPDSP